MIESMPRGKQCVVIGGGIAGLTAAATLADAGARVTLVEANAKAGGCFATVGSFEVKHNGKNFSFPIEHGLHGIWRQYRNLRRLLMTLDSARALVPVATQEFIVPLENQQTWQMEMGACVRDALLPHALAPLALFLNHKFLRVAAGEGLPRFFSATLNMMAHTLSFDAARDVALYDRFTVADFVHDWPPLLQRLTSALTHSGFFCDPAAISFAAFLTGLSYYLTDDKRNSAFHVLPADSESELIAPLCRKIQNANGEVLLQTRAEKIIFDSERAVAVDIRRNGENETRRLTADAFVLALKPSVLMQVTEKKIKPRVLPKTVGSASVRLWYSESPARSCASSGVFSFLDADNFFWLDRLQKPFSAWHSSTQGSVIECHLYGARAEEAMTASDDAVSQKVARTVQRTWGNILCAPVFAHVQLNLPTHVVFSPGVMSALPPVTTSFSNLTLCGDWIASPYPALNLERACMTGLDAARQVALELHLEISKLPLPLAPFPTASSVAMLRTILRARRGAQSVLRAAV